MSHLENQLDNMFNSGESERESLIKELEPLRAENAKLKMLHNAEIALADMLKCRVNELEAERDEYLANKILDASDKKLLDRLLAEREAMMKQSAIGQIDAIEILRKVFDLYESGADCYDSEDHYSAAYLGRCIRLDDDLFKSCVDLLSASQPKGDL